MPMRTPAAVSRCTILGLVLLALISRAAAQTGNGNQAPQTLVVQVASGTDDVEESIRDGRSYIDSSDLELVDDAEYIGKQLVGVRFQEIGLPPKALITKAWIQFTAKTPDTGRTQISIRAELSPKSASFGSRYFELSRRQLTAGAVTWTPEAWTEAGNTGEAQRTTDLSALVQETVMQDGWSERSPITFIFAGSGRRSAFSFDGSGNDAPRLHVEYTTAIANTSPLALPDTAETAEATPVTIDVLANDSDPDGHRLTLAGAGIPEHGHAAINPDGTITYTPEKWYAGSDTFTYTIIDRYGGVATSSVSVTIAPSPNAVDDLAITPADTPVVINVLANDTGAGNAKISVIQLSQPADGTAVLNTDGTIIYKPAAGFIGSDLFTYIVGHETGGRTAASVTVHVGTGFGSTRFAVIGDFGTGNEDARAVSQLVKKLEPEFIVTVGDNIYGADMSPDNAVGQFYAPFIGNYRGLHGLGSDANRFFPALGNHDWRDIGLDTYLGYFDFPRSTSGNRRYYDFIKGPVHFFVLDSDELEPDGRTSTSTQAQWLKREMSKSITPWQVIVMHEPPFSTGGEYGGAEVMQWPFEDWGADAVLSGHEHHYERLMKDANDDGRAIPYFVNGSGGAKLYSFNKSTNPDSAYRYDDDFGAMIIEATDSSLKFEFWSVKNGGTMIDRY
jgi:hypothetical protein